MKVISYEIKNGQTKILFQCTKCKKTHRNKTADDDEIGELIKQTKNIQTSQAPASQ